MRIINEIKTELKNAFPELTMLENSDKGLDILSFLDQEENDEIYQITIIDDEKQKMVHIYVQLDQTVDETLDTYRAINEFNIKYDLLNASYDIEDKTITISSIVSYEENDNDTVGTVFAAMNAAIEEFVKV